VSRDFLTPLIFGLVGLAAQLFGMLPVRFAPGRVRLEALDQRQSSLNDHVDTVFCYARASGLALFCLFCSLFASPSCQSLCGGSIDCLLLIQVFALRFSL